MYTTLKLRCAMAGMVAVLGMTPALFGLDIVSIEEHWELNVEGPDANRSAPQASLVMSPTGDLNCDYFVFTVNHSSLRDFTEGGMQVQHWSGDQASNWITGSKHGPLAHDGETVQWKQRMSLNDGAVVFEILDGQSQTWESFGGDGSLSISAPMNLQTLAGYRPSLTVRESGIGYAGNRVSSLLLKKITWVTSDGEEHSLVAPIDVNADLAH